MIRIEFLIILAWFQTPQTMFRGSKTPRRPRKQKNLKSDFWKIRHFISKWCNSRYCVFVFAYLCICVFVFGLRCLKPGQKFRKFNSDHFPFFKNLKRTSGAKVRSFPTLVKKWQFTPVLLLKDRNIKKVVKIHSLG